MALEVGLTHRDPIEGRNPLFFWNDVVVIERDEAVAAGDSWRSKTKENESQKKAKIHHRGSANGKSAWPQKKRELIKKCVAMLAA